MSTPEPAAAGGVDQATARARFARIRDGDEPAWRALTDQYTGLLWSITRGYGLDRADAAEAVQTTWLRLIENMAQIRQPEHLGSWLATTVRRECLALLRRTAREQVRPADEWPDLPDGAAAPDDRLLRDERDAALWRAFGLLTGACQALLRVLLAEPRPSYAEVSAALDMPVGSIGPRRQRCLAQLRELLGSGDGLPRPGGPTVEPGR